MSRMTHDELVAMLAAQQEQTAAIVAHLQATTADSTPAPAKKPKAKPRKTAKRAASKPAPTPEPSPEPVATHTQASPAAKSATRSRTTTKSEKVPYAMEEFTGNGVTVRIEKYHGKRWHPETNPTANYGVATSPDDPRMRLYLNRKTSRILCLLFRSNEAQPVLNFMADC